MAYGNDGEHEAACGGHKPKDILLDSFDIIYRARKGNHADLWDEYQETGELPYIEPPNR